MTLKETRLSSKRVSLLTILAISLTVLVVGCGEGRKGSGSSGEKTSSTSSSPTNAPGDSNPPEDSPQVEQISIASERNDYYVSERATFTIDMEDGRRAHVDVDPSQILATFPDEDSPISLVHMGKGKYGYTTPELKEGVYTLKVTTYPQGRTGRTEVPTSASSTIAATMPTENEVLFKVEDNYSQIRDLEYTVTGTSTMQGRRAETTTYEVIMKAPDKLKVISDEVTIILNGEEATIIEKDKEPMTRPGIGMN